jgi:hypothetical protein
MNNNEMKKYSWETAVRLAGEIQAKDIKAAERSISMLIDYIYEITEAQYSLMKGVLSG